MTLRPRKIMNHACYLHMWMLHVGTLRTHEMRPGPSFERLSLQAVHEVCVVLQVHPVQEHDREVADRAQSLFILLDMPQVHVPAVSGDLSVSIELASIPVDVSLIRRRRHGLADTYEAFPPPVAWLRGADIPPPPLDAVLLFRQLELWGSFWGGHQFPRRQLLDDTVFDDGLDRRGLPFVLGFRSRKEWCCQCGDQPSASGVSVGLN